MKLCLKYQYPCPREIERNLFILGNAQRFGYEVTEEVEEADVIIFSGCASRTETIRSSEAILTSIISNKKKRALLLTLGCYAEHKEKELRNNPHITEMIGSTEELMEFLWDLVNFSENYPKLPFMIDEYCHMPGLLIGRGCRFGCKFCKCHYLNCELKSVPLPELAMKMYFLREHGVHFLTFTALNSNQYGLDLKQGYGLSDLIKLAIELGFKAIDIKAMNVLETGNDRKLMETLVNSKIPIRLDLPLQHSSDEVLEQMGRRITRERTETIVRELQTNDLLHIFSGIMVGFPGETRKQMEHAFEWHKELGLYDFDLFAYSDHPEIPSHKYEQLSEDEHDRRAMTGAMLRNMIRDEGMKRLVGTVQHAMQGGKEVPGYRVAPGLLDYQSCVILDPYPEQVPEGLLSVKITGVRDYKSFTGELIGMALEEC